MGNNLQKISQNIEKTFNKPNNDSEITNYETIFTDINHALNRKDHPSVEYVMARPHSNFELLGMGFNGNWYGHSAVMYTMPNGERKVFNVVGGKPINRIVETHLPEEYIFTRNSNQGGIFNRNFLSIRVQDVSPELIIKMDNKFQEISNKSNDGDIKFDIGFGPIINPFKYVFPNMVERGNCARWVSTGLIEAGLIKRKSMWPKSIFIDMFENCEETNVKSYDNIDIVSYKCMYHVKKDYGLNLKNPIDLVSPLQIFRNIFYWNLDACAHATVHVPEEDNKAIVTVHDRSLAKKPSFLRNSTINNPYFVAATSIMSLFLLKRYPGRYVYNRFKKNNNRS